MELVSSDGRDERSPLIHGGSANPEGTCYGGFVIPEVPEDIGCSHTVKSTLQCTN